MDSKITYSQSYRYQSYILPALAVALVLLVLIKLMWYSRMGLDFTDEGFYLVMISNPSAYDFSFTLFGFIYHPIYVLLDGDITNLRRVNVITTFLLAWVLSYFLLKTFLPNFYMYNKIQMHMTAMSCGAPALILFSPLLLTPNYNSLALQALLVVSLGLIFADRVASFTSIIGWGLMGFGGWLTFMAKPSSALALIIAIAPFLLLLRKQSFRLCMFALSISTVLLLVTAIAIDGTTLNFIQRLRLGLEFAELLGGGHTLREIFRIDSFPMNKELIKVILILGVAVLFAMWGLLCKKKLGFRLFSLIVAIYFAAALWMLFWSPHMPIEIWDYREILIFGMVLVALSSGLILGGMRVPISKTQSWSTLCVFFLIVPFVYAFGTNNNYWIVGSYAGIFWFLSGLIFVGSMLYGTGNLSILMPYIFLAELIVVLILQTGIERPYRQDQSLTLNSSLSKIGPHKTDLVLSGGYAKYIADATHVAQVGNFKSKTPIIDLSGQSPGILYALDADSIGQPWMIGGYPGSLRLAQVTLTRVPCEKIASAWLLVEQNGPRSISIEVMSLLGSTFPSDYTKVGGWSTPNGAGGYMFPRYQELFKPVATKKIFLNCELMRGGI